MRVGGRVRFAAGAGGYPILCLLYLITLIYFATSDYAAVPQEIKLWDTGRTPLAEMVDVTNSFGLKVLAEHNFLNDNNIAFSPYGLMGILVALYEGVDGESSYQIHRAMRLPWNRNNMRIGFRDIHRMLKTYFVPDEGFLAGLALNKENVTFNEGYKTILRFYGFDLDTNVKIPEVANDTTGNTTTPASNSTTSAPAADAPTTMAATTREETTPKPSAETLNDIDIRGPDSTTAIPQTSPQTEGPSTTAITTTAAPTPEETQTTPTPTTAAETETVSVSTQAATSTAAMINESTVNNEINTVTTTDSTVAATTAITETSETMLTETTTMTTSTDDVTTNVASESTVETLQRRKKSIVEFLYARPASTYADDYIMDRSYNIPFALDSSNFTPDENKMFIANGFKYVEVTYMHYDTILEHAYLPHLDASALRLPLDSDRYYLLVILPAKVGALDLDKLLARMATGSDLSDVCTALRPRRVRAAVPGFTVKGHITLTTDLQKLGIRNVFDPRQRDFTPMTHQNLVYVRSIEQAVSVAIRKYRENDSNVVNRYNVLNRQPVTFSATYPFLYFVMDTSIHVALMAGKMVDPLNSRIL